MLRRFIVKSPTVSFVILTFAFSYSAWFAWLWIAASGVVALPDLAANYLGRAGVVFGPAAAALVVTAVTAGRDGVVALLSRLRVHRRDLIWFASLPAFGLATTIAALRVTGVSSATVTSALERDWDVLLMHYALQFLVVGIGEELGWRGWLLPQLLSRHTRLRATLLTAAVWCVWHLPLLFSGATIAAALVVAVFALSFLFTPLWVHARQSVAVMAIAHASHNTPTFFFESAVGYEQAGSAWLAASLLYACFAGVLVATMWPWWRRRGVEGC